MAGPLCEFPADTAWSLKDVRTVLEKATGVPSAEQRLLAGTEEPSSEGLHSPLVTGGAAVELTMVRVPVVGSPSVRAHSPERRAERSPAFTLWEVFDDTMEGIAMVYRIALDGASS